jgi:OPT family oligopeptide transporter
VTRIITPEATIDLEKYKNYSPLLQGPRIALAYALSFASISCVLVNAALYDGKELIRRFRSKQSHAEDDVHMRAMRNYSEVPDWWYIVLFVLLFAASLAGVVAWPTFLPWWGFILTILLPIIFILPVGVIEARTSSQIGLNVITEFIAGYIWPGKPIANTLVKIYGYMAMSRGLLFASDLKLGIYMKIPPRAMFRFQIVGTVISNLTSLSFPHFIMTKVQVSLEFS